LNPPRHPRKGADAPVQYGLIAEEVAKVFPDMVQYDKDGKPFTVYYHFLTPLLLSEVQHQQAKLSAVQGENRRLVEEVASLRKQVASQTAQMASFEQKFAMLQHVVYANANNAPARSRGLAKAAARADAARF
jgi:hypothetical protein